MDTLLDTRTNLGGHNGVDSNPLFFFGGGLHYGKPTSHAEYLKKRISLLCYNACLLLENMLCFLLGCCSMLAIENSSGMKMVRLALPGNNAWPTKPKNISEARLLLKGWCIIPLTGESLLMQPVEYASWTMNLPLWTFVSRLSSGLSHPANMSSACRESNPVVAWKHLWLSQCSTEPSRANTRAITG